MHPRIITILFLLFVILTACVPSQEIERLGIINTYGVDIAEDNQEQIEVTAIMLQFNDQTNRITETISGTGNTIRGAHHNAASETSFKLSPGQIRLVLYGKETAEKGIKPYLGSMFRDARVSDMMYSAVSNTTAKEVLTVGQDATTIDLAQYLQELIEKRIMDDSIPDISAHYLTHAIGDVGQDPLLPLFDIIDSKPVLAGMAVFQDEKYVGEISMEDAFLINLFQKKIQDKPLELSISKSPFANYIQKQQDDREQLHIDILVVDGKSKTEIVNANELHFQTDVDLEISLYEVSELLRVKNDQVANLFEQEIEKEVKRQYEELLANMQEVNADPFGFGNIYRIHTTDGKLTKKAWDEKFPDATVDFNVNVSLENYGSVK